jgi:hypothetical protein
LEVGQWLAPKEDDANWDGDDEGSADDSDDDSPF